MRNSGPAPGRARRSRPARARARPTWAGWTGSKFVRRGRPRIKSTPGSARSGGIFSRAGGGT